MKVLVTGGNGFLGSYVQQQLWRDGHTPIVVDKPDSVLDIGPSTPVADAVIHMAGVLGTAELFKNFDTAVDVNVKGTQRVLEYCRLNDARYVGITMPTVWANVYQATKLCARTLCTAWHESFGVPVSHVRAYNAFGIGQKYGPGHPQKIIPTFSTLAWRGEPIPIWGDGEQTVDLISAADIASVLVQAMAYGNDEVFDAGGGQERTVNSVAEFVVDCTHSPSIIEHLPMRPGERPNTHLCAKGEGWDKLTTLPTFDASALIATVHSYK
jgi:UDP-glucose 4-epimerase